MTEREALTIFRTIQKCRHQALHTNDCGNCERCQYRLEQEQIDGAVALAISALEKHSRIITVTDVDGAVLASISNKDIVWGDRVRVIVSEEKDE